MAAKRPTQPERTKSAPRAAKPRAAKPRAAKPRAAKALAAKPRAANKPRAVCAAEARAWLVKSYGGFPEINGRKHSYPAKSERGKWVCLAQRALGWQRERVWCFREGREPPPRNAQFEYLLFHGRPEQIARRAKRNNHRKRLGAPPGTEVHHTNRRQLALSSAVVVTAKQHDRIHAAEAAEEKAARAAARARK